MRRKNDAERWAKKMFSIKCERLSRSVGCRGRRSFLLALVTAAFFASSAFAANPSKFSADEIARLADSKAQSAGYDLSLYARGTPLYDGTDDTWGVIYRQNLRGGVAFAVSVDNTTGFVSLQPLPARAPVTSVPRQSPSWIRMVLLAAGGIGALALFLSPWFSRPWRFAPWVRWAFWMLGPIGWVWSALGFLLLESSSAFSASARELMMHAQTLLSGAGTAIALLCIVSGALFRRDPA
jgi:hypothetical protein